MFSNNSIKSFFVIFMSALLSLNALANQSASSISDYSSDFESLTANAAEGTPGASDLENDGWQVGGSVFDSAGNWLYFYGWFVAPNINQAFASVATGDDTKDDSGVNYLNVFSDYQNAAHGEGKTVESLLVKRYTISSADIGKTLTFSFDAKRPEVVSDGFGGDSSPAVGNGCAGTCVAGALIKTIDPSDNYATTNDIRENTTEISQSEWTSYSMTLDLSDPLLEGQELQVGFDNSSSGYDNTGVYYDNVSITFSSGNGGGGDPVNEDEGEYVPFPAPMLLLLSLVLIGTGISYRIYK